VLIVGLGAAGVAVAKIFREAGVANQIVCDSKGALHPGRPDYQDGSMPAIKRWFAENTNPEQRTGGPADVIDGADLFVGLSGARVMPPEGARAHERRRDGVRDGQPEPRGHARGGRALRADHRHRPAPTTPTRSTTSSASPACSGRARRPRPLDHRGDEDGRRPRDRRDRGRRRAARGLHHPLRLQPRRRRRGGRRRRRPAKEQGAATAAGDEVGYAPGDTSDFRAVDA
jgi:malate dehydrogenase (oxaloacetate-decarboxylating)